MRRIQLYYHLMFSSKYAIDKLLGVFITVIITIVFIAPVQQFQSQRLGSVCQYCQNESRSQCLWRAALVDPPCLSVPLQLVLTAALGNCSTERVSPCTRLPSISSPPCYLMMQNWRTKLHWGPCGECARPHIKPLSHQVPAMKKGFCNDVLTVWSFVCPFLHMQSKRIHCVDLYRNQ